MLFHHFQEGTLFPIHLNLGFRVFYFYEGFYFMIAIVIGLVWAVRRIKKEGLNADRFINFAVFVMIGGILGGRLSSLLIYSRESFFANPLTFFSFWDGGISIIGALPWAVRFPRYGRFFPSFQIAPDHPTPAWQWSVRQGLIDPSSPVSAPIHPAALYESLGLWLLLAAALFLVRLAKKHGWSQNLVICLHLGGYALLRFFVEFFRADRESLPGGGLSVLQIILLFVFALSAGAAVFILVRKNKTPTIQPET
jgi:phosphatidylglycerol:prolipoprotein diacylglycerol transferase